MYQFKILVEGYAHSSVNGSYVAHPTTSIIYDEEFMLLVDPGTNSLKLKQAMQKQKLEFKNINKIFLSHYHPDHFLNLKLFPNADIYDGSLIWCEDREYQYHGKFPGTEIEVVATPGHASEMASLFFSTKKFGIVGLCQDVFWWEDGQQKSDTVFDLMNTKDPFMNDEKALVASRKLVLAKADWIVPGHGKMFKNPQRI